ncbi:hypothetical protein BDW02DRAFT_208321 [Decorospora gaudefroyi]|uniref:Uncharacterized protein n=1 Tax=Decorospora gaudefroyi TaxID=184978 RepID=A0A6A5KI37_9PLEO|nr:hypothetical protein BDW02DRAFT_208321 [Decorospora gaudefroyi]
MSLWRKCDRPANPAGSEPHDRASTSQLRSAEAGRSSISLREAFNETCHPALRPAAPGTRLPAPVFPNRNIQGRCAHTTAAAPTGPSAAHSRVIYDGEEKNTRGTVLAEPGISARPTARGWAHQASRARQESIGERLLDFNNRPDNRSSSGNRTPSWPIPAPDPLSTTDTTYTTARSQNTASESQRETSRPPESGLALSNSFVQLEGYDNTNSNQQCANDWMPRQTSAHRMPASTRLPELLEEVNSVVDEKYSCPPIPTRSPLRTSPDGSVRHSKSSLSSILRDSEGSAPAVHQRSQEYPKPISCGERVSEDLPFHEHMHDSNETLETTERQRSDQTLTPPPMAWFSNTGHSAQHPAPFSRRGTASDSHNNGEASDEDLRTEDDISEQGTLQHLREQLRSTGRSFNKELERTDEPPTLSAQDDRPSPYRPFTWYQIGVLVSILVGVIIYSFVALSRHRTGLAYDNWSLIFDTSTLEAISGDGNLSISHTASLGGTEMHAVSSLIFTIDSDQRADICSEAIMPTFNFTLMTVIDGLRNLGPQGEAFRAIAIPPFGNVFAFLVMVCGVYTLLYELLRRTLKWMEIRRYDEEDVGWFHRRCGKMADGVLAWAEILSILFASSITALLVSGIFMAWVAKRNASGG